MSASSVDLTKKSKLARGKKEFAGHAFTPAKDLHDLHFPGHPVSCLPTHPEYHQRVLLLTTSPLLSLV